MSEAKHPGVTCQLRVRYHETDAMGIVHHANYLTWFEVGRTEYLRAVGMTYRSMEEQGIASPVIGISSRYHHPARYDDPIELETWVQAYNGVRLTMGYAVRCDGRLLCSGQSEHAFTYRGRVVAPKRSLPSVHAILSACQLADRPLAEKADHP
ncbi:MAG: acyl-CoA thioesterase [Clostridiales bacterium]|nr:acyl-CoA thioesterase [Clostridiales bacterium]